ncbi:MAG: hypothetical protein AAGK47_06345 [Bacteroidota bacterium]
MKKSISLFLVIGIGIFFLSNSYKVSPPVAATFTPVEMPSKLQNGHAFPTDSMVVQSWIDQSFALNGLETQADIISHAWGLWHALVEKTNQKMNGRQLRRYETWYTPQDVMRATMKKTSLPKELSSTGPLQARQKFESSDGGFHGAELAPEAGNVVGKVKYNPVMAKHALKNRFFDEKVMRGKIKKNAINTIEFPATSVMLKPIYRVLTNRLKVYDDLYRFHVWSGKSDGGVDDNQFAKYIYVSTKANDSRVKDNADIYSIDDFIHHKMTAAEATEYNRTKPKEGQEYVGNVAAEGDIVILLGSHVASRETPRWTWQTFYWSPNPDNPVFPSSRKMADGRTTGLDPAARHYAVSLGYSMLSPALSDNLPEDIDVAKHGSVYSLNPYIEGPFNSAVKPFNNQAGFLAAYGWNISSLSKSKNSEGISSNCMSCHSQATYLGKGRSNAPIGVNMFLADQYVPRDAPWFIGRLQTSFVWSIAGPFEQPPSDFDKKK